jgi:hypothetical protein
MDHSRFSLEGGHNVHPDLDVTHVADAPNALAGPLTERMIWSVQALMSVNG